MAIEKICVGKGCEAYPCFGFGGKWACRLHRHLIWVDDVAVSPAQQREQSGAAQGALL